MTHTANAGRDHGSLFWLADTQMARLRSFFPKSRGKPRVDERRALSGREEEEEMVQ